MTPFVSNDCGERFLMLSHVYPKCTVTSLFSNFMQHPYEVTVFWLIVCHKIFFINVQRQCVHPFSLCFGMV